MPTQQEIIDYYHVSKFDYQLYNWRFGNLSMHYGLWDGTTRSHREALLNENRVVADTAAITAADYVMDFGCGCRVLGITISQEQVDEARRLAAENRVEHLVGFLQLDYHQTHLPGGTFDVVMAIESIAHSSAKNLVLLEAHRLLKPGGRIVVADGFFAKPKRELTPREHDIARACFEGVHVPPLPERHEFEEWLEDAAFSDIRWVEKTGAILPTARRVNRLGSFLMPISRILHFLGLRALQTSHMKAFIDQYYAFRDGLGVYGIYVARKAAFDHGERVASELGEIEIRPGETHDSF